MNGSQLKEIREAAGISQQELAGFLETSQYTISHWETSKTMLTKIKELASLSILDELLDDDAKSFLDEELKEFLDAERLG